MKKVSLGVSLLALALSTSLVPQAIAADAVTTISVSTWGSSPSETAALKDAVATFETRYPTIKVNLIVDNDHGAQMAARFASKTPNDVFYLDAGIAQDWAAQGVLLDLTPSITASNFNLAPFNASYLKPFQSGGKLFGLPKDANPLVLEGNLTLMKKAGLTALPKTIAEFEKHAKLLLAKKITPMCVDADINRLGAFFVSFGGGLSSASNQSLLSSAGSKAGLEWAMNNYKTGVFQTPAQLSAGWAGEAFGKAKCAYTMEGAWLDPYLKDSFPTVHKTMIKGALPVAKKAGSLAFTAAYAIGKDSPNPKEGWTFIEYMTGARGMTVWTSFGVAIPSRSDVATPLGYEINGAVAKMSTTVTTPAFKGWGDVVGAFNNEAKKQIQDKKFDVKKATAAIIAKANAAWPTA
jgi:multiple sugar transport system substrate-binding protein